MSLANLAGNPNIGGVLFVGLGCETTQADECASLVEQDPLAAGSRGSPSRVKAASAARSRPGSRRWSAAATGERLPSQRTALSGLTLALECGGSDGWSGVTANPLVGRVADEVVREGGTAVLSETPEIFGAEALLLERVASPEVGDALIAGSTGGSTMQPGSASASTITRRRATSRAG